MRSATTIVPAPVSRSPIARGAGMTHRGKVRDRNEDSILTDPSGRLWAVADGMGGYGHGEVASDIVIDSLEVIQDEDDPDFALHDRLLRANDAMLLKAEVEGMGQMGSTVVAAIIERGLAHIAWVGDSRAYLLRGRRMRLITRDHTVVQDLVDRGEITAEAAESHPESHIVTRAVGGQDALEVEQITLPLTQGDRLLLCSDGLPRCVYEPTIETVLSLAHNPKEACSDLVREALAQGAPDNVSVIVIDIGAG